MRRLRPARDFGIAAPDTARRGRPKKKKACAVCAVPFRPMSGSQVTCGDATCKTLQRRRSLAAYRARTRKGKRLSQPRAYREKACSACGASFQPRTGNQRVCWGAGCPPQP